MTQTTSAPESATPRTAKPKPIRDALAKIREQLREFINAQKNYGGLIPQALAAKALGVSTARIAALVNEKRFEVITLFGRRYIGGRQFEEFILQERKAGRPVNEPTTTVLVTEALRESVEAVRPSKKSQNKG